MTYSACVTTPVGQGLFYRYIQVVVAFLSCQILHNESIHNVSRTSQDTAGVREIMCLPHMEH